MSGTRSSAAEDDGQRQLEELAVELYALPPDAFTGARDEEVHKARSAGQQALARDLSRLRRPTQSAWLVNLLWRDQRDLVEQFLEVGAELSRAQARGSVADFHRLAARRGELEAALIRRARALGDEVGVKVTAAMDREVQETLAAALASANIAAELRTGRLVKPASYAGFGLLESAAPFTDAEPRKGKEPEARLPAPSRRRKADGQAAPADRRERERREEAERHLAEARAALEAAARALADRTREVESADQHRQEARSQVEQLRRRLRELEQQAAHADQAARAAERRKGEAEKAHKAALQTLERAERRLKA